MFQHLQAAPPDAILGLNEAFAADTTEGKINLTTGVYKDATGITPVLDCVKQAERRLVETETSKGYLGIDGMKEFGDRARGLLFGTEHEITTSGRTATIQAPGGTGALRVAAEFCGERFPMPGSGAVGRPGPITPASSPPPDSKSMPTATTTQQPERSMHRHCWTRWPKSPPVTLSACTPVVTTRPESTPRSNNGRK